MNQLRDLLPRLTAIATCIHLLASPAVVYAEADLPSGFVDQELMTGFDKPVGFAFLPDGRIIVIEQDSGRLWLYVEGQPRPAAPMCSECCWGL